MSPGSQGAVVAKWGSEEKFLKEYSEVVDKEIRGIKFGDSSAESVGGFWLRQFAKSVI